SSTRTCSGSANAWPMVADCGVPCTAAIDAAALLPHSALSKAPPLVGSLLVGAASDRSPVVTAAAPPYQLEPNTGAGTSGMLPWLRTSVLVPLRLLCSTTGVDGRTSPPAIAVMPWVLSSTRLHTMRRVLALAFWISTPCKAPRMVLLDTR